jgi:hypothetical protein
MGSARFAVPFVLTFLFSAGVAPAAVVQWDFEGDLASTTGGADLVPVATTSSPWRRPPR